MDDTANKTLRGTEVGVLTSPLFPTHDSCWDYLHKIDGRFYVTSEFFNHVARLVKAPDPKDARLFAQVKADVEKLERSVAKLNALKV